MTEEKKDTTFGPITACYVALDKAINGFGIAKVPTYLYDTMYDAVPTLYAMDDALNAAIEAWEACDEPRYWVFSDGHDTFPHGPHKPSEMKDGSIFEAWLSNAPGSDWEWEDGELTTVYIKGWYAMQDPTTGRAVDATGGEAKVAIHPPVPDCTEDEHDWDQPEGMVRAMRAEGGGIVYEHMCLNCGMYMTHSNYATDPADGTQGHVRVTYRKADDASYDWLAEQKRTRAVLAELLELQVDDDEDEGFCMVCTSSGSYCMTCGSTGDDDEEEE